MAEVVDAIIAELTVRGIDQYVANFNKGTEAHERFAKSIPKIGIAQGISEQDAQRYADRHKSAVNDVAKGEEQATERVARTRKTRTDAEKAEAAATKAAAKERADAAKAAAKAEADAAKEVAKAAADRLKAERDYETAVARVREGEIQSARKQREQLRALRDDESQRGNQAKAAAFLAPLGARGLSGQSARSSADVFKEQFRVEAAEAREAAKAETELARARTAAGSAAERAAAQEAASANRQYGNLGRLPRAPAGTFGGTVPREGTGQSSIPSAIINGGADASVAAEAEVDRLKVDQITHQAALNTLKGAERRETQDNLAAIRLEKQLRAENVAEEEILLRLETLRAGQAARNAAEQRAQSAKGGTRNAEQFARGAGFYQATGGGYAVAGIATAAAAYGATEAVSSGIAFAKQISDTAAATGVGTKAIQVYQAAARQAGATNEQLQSSFARLNDQVGRAKEGDEQATKTFNALGISLKGVKSAGDVLPSVVDRLSQIKDPAERAAVGTRLFGEEYRRLDAVLGQGTGKINALAASLERTGSILSGRDIATLKDASAVLGEIKARLEVDLARVVAGNAQAILGLANAFGNLADKALKALQAIGRIKAQNATLQGGGTDGDRQTLLADSQGRQFLLQQNSAALRANREQSAAVGGSSALMRVGGKNVTGAQFYADQRRQLLASRREVLNYRDPADITTPVQPGKTGDISGLFAPKGPKGPKNKTDDQLAAEQAERNRQYLDRLAALQETNLRAQEALTGDISKQADIEAQLADRALKKNLDDIEQTKTRNIARINAEHAADADKKAAVALETAHAAELTAAAKAADAASRKVTAQDTQAKLIAASNAHLQTQLSIDAEIASTNGQLATTRKERLAAELRLLDIQQQQERASLQAQRATLKPGDPAAADIDVRVGALSGQYAAKAQATRKGNASPLEQYHDRLKGAVGDTNDALESVEVNLASRLDDQISSTIGKVLGLKGAFGELASSVIADLAKIGIEKAILGGFSSIFGGGDVLSSLFSGGNGTPPVVSLPARATGGPVVGGQTYLVGERGPELFTAPTGGKIVPNNAILSANGGGSQVIQHITIDQRGSVTPDAYRAGILSDAAGTARGYAVRAGTTALNAAPARVAQTKILQG